MSYLTTLLLQDATYWEVDSVDRFGDAAFKTSIALKVKWEQRSDLFVDSKGVERRSSAKVWLSRDVEEGGMMMLGFPTESPDDPTLEIDALRIGGFRKIPDYTGTSFERVAFMVPK